jgi:hypothetical protein
MTTYVEKYHQYFIYWSLEGGRTYVPSWMDKEK